MRTTTGISLPLALRQAAERRAKQEYRSLSGLLGFALARYLREVGAWEEPEVEETGGLPEGR